MLKSQKSTPRHHILQPVSPNMLLYIFSYLLIHNNANTLTLKDMSYTSFHLHKDHN